LAGALTKICKNARLTASKKSKIKSLETVIRAETSVIPLSKFLAYQELLSFPIRYTERKSQVFRQYKKACANFSRLTRSCCVSTLFLLIAAWCRLG
ncbi:MAG: hypothetical protein H9993_03235, partial [Candidatus Desulfovibrio faecigallinarum]|nr:hypothetical protein [Candidatus Desulfovibrio faecigallinarum]